MLRQQWEAAKLSLFSFSGLAMLQVNNYRKFTLTHQSKVPPPRLQKVQHDISNSNCGIYFDIVTDKNAHLSCMVVIFGRFACYFAVLIFLKNPF